MALTVDGYEGLARVAGFSGEQINGLYAGLRNLSTLPLELEREVYDRFQRLVERALLQERAPQADPQGHPYLAWYLTEHPLTPFWHVNHPRTEVVQSLFDASGGLPRACAVFTEHGLRDRVAALTPEQKAQFLKILKANEAKDQWPTITATRSFHPVPGRVRPSIGYFAVPGRMCGSIAFHAPQSTPGGLSTAPGRLYFGNDARAMIQSVRMTYDASRASWTLREMRDLLER